MHRQVQPSRVSVGELMSADVVAWEYELVPLLILPQVDLTPSLKSRLPRITLLHAMLRKFFKSPFTMPAYMGSLFLTISVCFVPYQVGTILAIVALFTGLPAALVGIVTLRFEMVAMLLKTYDIWFFSTTSTVASLLLGTLVGGLRSLVALVPWLSFFVNIFVDGNLSSLRNVWVANVVSMICFVTTAVVVGTGLIPGFHHFDVVVFNGHALPAAAIARDGLLSMAVVILRNVVRRSRNVGDHRAATAAGGGGNSTTSVMMCVSFRCRLQLCPIPCEQRSQDEDPAQIDAVRLRSGTSTTLSGQPQKVQLRMTAFLGPLDVRRTLLPLPFWIWGDEPRSMMPRPSRLGAWGRRAFKGLGLVGLTVAVAGIAVGVVSPDFANERRVYIAASLGSSASLLFAGMCLSLCQRQLLRAVATSFDFIYITFQLVAIHIAFADLMRWHSTTTISLLATWTWSMWVLFWDALMPPMRKWLGLGPRHAAFICTVLLVTVALAAGAMFLILPPNRINDRVVAALPLMGHRIEFRMLSWYFSGVLTISAWVVRLLWRLWQATENELVVLDGPVGYNYCRHVRGRGGQTAVAAAEIKTHDVVPG